MKPIIRSIVSLLSIGTALTACAPQVVRLPVPFSAQEARAILAPGKGQMSGKINFEPDRGHVLAYPDTVVSCAGYEVILIPYTDYAREWALRTFGKPVTDLAYRLTNRGSSSIIEGESDFLAVTRKTRCDENGNFGFDRVGKGEYFVLARVQWLGKDEQAYHFGFAPEDIDEEDGFIIKKITVPENGSLVLNGPWP